MPTAPKISKLELWVEKGTGTEFTVWSSDKIAKRELKRSGAKFRRLVGE